MSYVISDERSLKPFVFFRDDDGSPAEQAAKQNAQSPHMKERKGQQPAVARLQRNILIGPVGIVIVIAVGMQDGFRHSQTPRSEDDRRGLFEVNLNLGRTVLSRIFRLDQLLWFEDFSVAEDFAGGLPG